MHTRTEQEINHKVNTIPNFLIFHPNFDSYIPKSIKIYHLQCSAIINHSNYSNRVMITR